MKLCKKHEKGMKPTQNLLYKAIQRNSHVCRRFSYVSKKVQTPSVQYGVVLSPCRLQDTLSLGFSPFNKKNRIYWIRYPSWLSCQTITTTKKDFSSIKPLHVSHPTTIKYNTHSFTPPDYKIITSVTRKLLRHPSMLSQSPL